jgi:N6-adenosine-specific RNA methylase IME4
VRYEAMRTQLAECARVDEAKDIRDKAEALRAYSRQREDKEAEQWFEDIKVRAIGRIGDLSAALPQASPGGSPPGKRGGGGSTLSGGEVSKKAALKSANLTEKAAAEAEKVAKIVKLNPGKRLRLRDVRQIIKKERRSERESSLAEATLAASRKLGRQVFGVIYADPPWRWEPYSRETGMDRAADNHYPTMTPDEIGNIVLPAARDCVLFLWSTAAMQPAAHFVLTAWGFSLQTHCVWVKDRIGTGYWFRNKHELLLLATRGQVPAPAPGEQFPSVIEADVGAHSAKPDVFAQMIETMFPNLPRLEMFGRKRREGWVVWGNEAEKAA